MPVRRLTSREHNYPIIRLESPYGWDPFASIVSEHRTKMAESLAEARKRRKDLWHRLKKFFTLRGH